MLAVCGWGPVKSSCVCCRFVQQAITSIKTAACTVCYIWCYILDDIKLTRCPLIGIETRKEMQRDLGPLCYLQCAVITAQG